MTIFNNTTNLSKQREALIQERMRLMMERKYYVKITKQLVSEGRAISKVYKRTGSMTALNTSLEKQEKRLAKIFRRMYTESVNAGRDHVLEDYSPPKHLLSIQVKNMEGAINQVLLEWVNIQTAKKVKQVSRTTKKKISGIIRTGVHDGLSTDEVARNINNVIKTISPTRARTIARTETHSAMQSSQLATVKQLPSQLPLQKEWVSVEDSRTRHTHDEADGQTVPIDAFYNIGGVPMQYPGDPSAPPGEIINCRCVQVFKEGSINE